MTDWLQTLKRRYHPPLWRVKDYADGWIVYDTEEDARASEEAKNGALVERVPPGAASSTYPPRSSEDPV
jgi:hypothetical protein